MKAVNAAAAPAAFHRPGAGGLQAPQGLPHHPHALQTRCHEGARDPAACAAPNLGLVAKGQQGRPGCLWQAAFGTPFVTPSLSPQLSHVAGLPVPTQGAARGLCAPLDDAARVHRDQRARGEDSYDRGGRPGDGQAGRRTCFPGQHFANAPRKRSRVHKGRHACAAHRPTGCHAVRRAALGFHTTENFLPDSTSPMPPASDPAYRKAATPAPRTAHRLPCHAASPHGFSYRREFPAEPLATSTAQHKLH